MGKRARVSLLMGERGHERRVRGNRTRDKAGIRSPWYVGGRPRLDPTSTAACLTARKSRVPLSESQRTTNLQNSPPATV